MKNTTAIGKNIEPNPKQPDAETYLPQGDEAKVFSQWRDRKRELLLSRKNIYGLDIDQKMRDMDRKYFNRTAEIPPSELDTDQTPIAINNAFGKIQAALSLMIENNPDIVLQPSSKKFVANKILIRALAKKSWQRSHSLEQFRLFVFNCCKRGWAAGRTFHRKLDHMAKFPDHIDEKTGKVVYEDKLTRKMDDVAFMNLDTHNVWVDEEAKPFDMFSIRDWQWRELWHIDKVRQIFPIEEYPNMKYVKEGGDTRERVEEVQQDPGQAQNQARQIKKGMTELFFYENQYEDKFIVEVNGVMVLWEPLPQWHKRISLVLSLWNLRSAEDIYGIGTIEEMEKDETLIDRILNMTMRQLLLSINPPGFYSGTEDMENENIKLRAGVVRRTLDPKGINFLTIPSPGQEPMHMISWLENKEDQRTGITKLVEGEIPTQTGSKGKLATEFLVAREASLRKLQIPKHHFESALSWEFINRIKLIQQVYSDFEVQHLSDEEEYLKYLEEVKADRSFFFIENEGDPGKEKFYKKIYREVPLSVEQDESGQFLESEDERFFQIKPEWLPWEGDLIIDMNAMLSNSDELDKANTLQMSNLLVPLFQGDPKINLKIAKQIVLSFKKDPEKWFPKQWIEFLRNPELLDQAPGQAAQEGMNAAKGGGGKPAPAPQKKPTSGPASWMAKIGQAFKGR